MRSPRTLTHEQARAFYDRLGSRQDSQAFYEDAATSELLAFADFGAARSVFEFGCGTGRFAETLLTEHLPGDARYHGVDVSSTMVGLATRRLERFGERARVRQTEGSPRLDAPDGGFDRFVTNYVLDLLSESDILALLGEARRVLEPGGLLCVAALTGGRTPLTRLVSALWAGVHRLRPQLVGGCRAIELLELLPEGAWEIRHSGVIARFGLTSEVVVAARVG